MACSTAVVQTTVNRWVAGSNPAGPAQPLRPIGRFYQMCPQ